MGDIDYNEAKDAYNNIVDDARIMINSKNTIFIKKMIDNFKLLGEIFISGKKDDKVDDNKTNNKTDKVDNKTNEIDNEIETTSMTDLESEEDAAKKKKKKKKKEKD